MTPDTVVKYEPEFESGFPFVFMSARGENREPLFFHWHDYLEIDWVVGGRGTNYIADKEYQLCAGQLYLINDLDRHIAVTDGSLDMKILVFDAELVSGVSQAKWEYLRAFYPVGSGAANLIELTRAQRQQVETLFSDMEREWTERLPGYQLMLAALLDQLLALCYRATAGKSEYEDAQRRKNYEKLAPAIQLIKASFKDELTPALLSDACHMSRTYFSALFSRTMGVPCSGYIERIRINYACMLLSASGRPVTDIALESGFASISTFNSAFKRLCHVTPSQYRAGTQGE